ncbi:MAG TPA: hypothetical protein VFK34_04880 [Marmoricola sp.]|jgi:hypothetical protein|nr:hypothetical protein [Marmoricola sp.]
MTLLILVGILVAAFVVWKFRVPLLARLLGQPEARIARQLDKKRR